MVTGEEVVFITPTTGKYPPTHARHVSGEVEPGSEGSAPRLGKPPDTPAAVADPDARHLCPDGIDTNKDPVAHPI
jgi:hypothetical protein